MSDDHVKETLEALIKARPKAVESEQGEKLLAGWVEGVGEGLVALARWVLLLYTLLTWELMQIPDVQNRFFCGTRKVVNSLPDHSPNSHDCQHSSSPSICRNRLQPHDQALRQR